MLSNQRIRFGAALFGIGMTLLGTLLFIVNVVEWIVSNTGAFSSARSTVVAAMLISGGLHVILATLFISIFAGRIEKQSRNASRRDAYARGASSTTLDINPMPEASAHAVALDPTSPMLLDGAAGEVL
jgi:hypothetical protein